MKKDHNHHTFLPVTIILAAMLLLTLSGCEKLIDNNPSSVQLLDKEVFKDSSTVSAAIAGMYGRLASGQAYTVDASALPSFSADELAYVGNTYDEFIGNSILPANNAINSLWSTAYAIIYYANAIVEGTPNGSNLTPQFQSRSVAEARFMRAFCYFYLVNLFGDVPLVITTDVEQNKISPRSPVSEVYDQMTDDLLFAQANLPADYSLYSGLRVRANKWVATALLARVYLYRGNWAEAESQSTSLLENNDLFALEDLANVFTPASTEAILQVYNSVNGVTSYASAMLPNPQQQVPKYIFTEQLKTAFAADAGGRTTWSGTIDYNGTVYTYPAKYKNLVSGANAEYLTVFRLAEQYLIRAEARAQRNNVDGARADLLAVRRRAGLGATPANDKDALLLAVERERMIELNSEMGHRWFDLKRTGRVNAVIGSAKPDWKPEAALYPVPADQRTRNGNLTQNPGYN